MMYNNFYNTGRHMNWGGQENFFGPNLFWGATIFGGIFLLMLVVSLALKGYALWTAAKRKEVWWFVALLFINTMGILELVYLIFFAKVLFRKCCKGKCDEKCCEHEEHNTKEN